MDRAWVGPWHEASGLGDTAASFPAGGGTVREVNSTSRTVVFSSRSAVSGDRKPGPGRVGNLAE